MASIDGNAIADRMVGFIAHLRLNGFALGPHETGLAIRALGAARKIGARRDRLRLRTALCADRDQWIRFDDLFDAYWKGGGRARQPSSPSGHVASMRPAAARLWNRTLTGDRTSPRALDSSDPGSADPTGDGGEGRLIASKTSSVLKRDLREIVDREELLEAERIALKLAQSIRIRRARRRQAPRGSMVDLKRTLRACLARGGDPIDLFHRQRPARPVRLVLLLDVSGSMQVYSRFFLQFAKGLIDRWTEAEAFIFHTRLIKVSDALRERDPFRAMARMSLLTRGIGGGTRIGDSLAAFNGRHAAETLNSRGVVVVVSDGYDTGPPETIARELARLRRKARRIVWLNPLAGWKSYEPVARAMAAAMPYIDCLAPAGSLRDLAAIEPLLRRL